MTMVHIITIAVALVVGIVWCADIRPIPQDYTGDDFLYDDTDSKDSL